MTNSDAKPTVSFLIINKNDLGIRETLGALAAVRSSVAEVRETIVVDASDERMAECRRDFPDVTWVPFTPRPDTTTIPEQRNVAVARSSGDILVFIDASCVPCDGWLDRLIAPIVSDGELAVAGTHESVGTSSIRDEDSRVLGTPEYVREAPTMNLAVARRVFEIVGAFDDAFTYGSDVDFTWRLNDAGIRIRYVPDAAVAHEWGDTRSELKRSWLYGQARYRLYAKHRSRRRSILREDPVAVAYPAYLLLLPAALVQPLVLALLAVPLFRNRRNRPVLTLAHHLVYGSGVLTAAWLDLTGRLAGGR
jgi:glycosyltransferase involved in cell wall biosynthesis